MCEDSVSLDKYADIFAELLKIAQETYKIKVAQDNKDLERVLDTAKEMTNRSIAELYKLHRKYGDDDPRVKGMLYFIAIGGKAIINDCRAAVKQARDQDTDENTH